MAYLRDKNCIFCKIIEGEIPSSKVSEDESTLAFLDINPVNKGHTVVVHKNHYENVYDTPDESLKEIISKARDIAGKMKKVLGAEGTNFIMNNDKAIGQQVQHTHIHVIPRFKGDGISDWVQGKYGEGEIEKTLEKLKYS